MSVLPDTFRTELAERASEDRLELPMLPRTATDVVELCGSESCDARELAALIHRDPSLAGHVMRVANSVAYCPGEPIVSLQHAVSRLGMGALCEIAMGIAVKGRVFSVEGHEDRLRGLWRHSAFTGAYTKEIARSLRRNVEGAFLSGLLHDIGRPVVLQLATDLEREAGERLDPEAVELAMAELHGTVGAMLLDRWGLPAWMGAAAEHHHDYAALTEHRTEVMTVALADRLAHWAVEGDEDELTALRELPVLADLNLYADELQALLDQRGAILALGEAFA